MNATGTLKQLRTRGFRIGRVRREIITLFSTAKKPLSAQNIIALLEEKGIPSNKTTIYRELDFLLEQKLIHELFLTSSIRHFESSDQDHHHHLVCEACDTISPIEDHSLEKRLSTLEQQVYDSKKFNIKHHTLEFFGTCKQCQSL